MMDRNKISQLMKLADVFIDLDGSGKNLTEEQANQYDSASGCKTKGWI